MTIDEWPFLEIEGLDEEAVKSLGYDYDKCRICAVDVLYSEKYGIPEDIIDNHTPRIMFNIPNPFL